MKRTIHAAALINDDSQTGALNAKALENALNPRNQFGLTPAMGAAVGTYYDDQYYHAASGR
jgi:hypothetical protein